MAWDDSIRARLEALILGTYGNEFAIPAGTFQLADKARTLETTDPGSIERRVSIEINPSRTPVVPVDRCSGVGYYEYVVNVKAGYAITNAGADEPEVSTGQQSGSGLSTSVADRANIDRHRIEAALGSFRNYGGLDPHVIDLNPIGGGGLEQSGSRAILTVPFKLWVRIPLATS